MKRAALAFLLLTPCQGADEDQIVHPPVIYKCLGRPTASALVVDVTMNPYYLRGDFDGDRNPDYAVAVRGKTDQGLGILVCDGKGRAHLLGIANGGADSQLTLFSFAPTWAVLSRREATESAKLPPFGPLKLPALHGDVIAMIWEDGTGLIYWDGRAFKWLA